MNLIEIILQLMQDDDCNTSKQSDLLDHYFENASLGEQDHMDKVLITVCGYSYESLKGMQ